MLEGSFYIRFSNASLVDPVLAVRGNQYRILHTIKGYVISGSEVFEPTLSALCERWKKKLKYSYRAPGFAYSDDWEA